MLMPLGTPKWPCGRDGELIVGVGQTLNLLPGIYDYSKVEVHGILTLRTAYNALIGGYSSLNWHILGSVSTFIVTGKIDLTGHINSNTTGNSVPTRTKPDIYGRVYAPSDPLANPSYGILSGGNAVRSGGSGRNSEWWENVPVGPWGNGSGGWWNYLFGGGNHPPSGTVNQGGWGGFTNISNNDAPGGTRTSPNGSNSIDGIRGGGGGFRGACGRHLYIKSNVFSVYGLNSIIDARGSKGGNGGQGGIGFNGSFQPTGGGGGGGAGGNGGSIIVDTKEHNQSLIYPGLITASAGAGGTGGGGGWRPSEQATVAANNGQNGHNGKVIITEIP